MTLSILTVSLTITQFYTLQRVKRAVLSVSGTSGRISAISEMLSIGDIILLSAILITIVYAFWIEIRGKRISADYRRLIESEKGTLAILLLLALASARFYLSPGEIILGDAPCHMSRVYAAAESISSGSWPSWSFYNYCGFPLLRFYAPGFFLITGTISLLTGSPEWSVKVFLFLMHAGSAFPVYFWARATGASRVSSLLSGAVITLSFLHTHTVIWTGSLPISAIFVLYPLILLALEKSFTGGKKRWLMVLALSISLIVLFHHGYAAYGLQLAVLYLMLRWLLSGEGKTGIRPVIRIGLAIISALLMCAFFLLPVLKEGHWVFHQSDGLNLKLSISNLAFWKSLLIWRNVWSGWTIAYIGLSVFAMFLAGSFQVIRNKNGEKPIVALRAALITALIALSWAWGTGRIINLALPFIAILAGFSVTLVSRKRHAGFSLILLLILIVDLGPTTIQAPFRTGRSFIKTGLQNTGESISPERVFIGFHNGSAWAYPHWGYCEGTGIIQPAGFFPQGAPRMINTITATLDNLNSCGDSLNPSVIDQLFLLNISGLTMRTRESYIQPEPLGTQGPEIEPPVAWILPSSPLIFSSRITSAPPDSLTEIQESEPLMMLPENDPKRLAYSRFITDVTNQMYICREKATAEIFFLWPGQIETERDVTGDPPDKDSPVTIRKYDVSLKKATIRFKAESEGWLRASFSWYPSLQIIMDDQKIDYYRSILGACIFRVTEGEHTLELSPKSSSPIPGLSGLILGLMTMGIACRIRNRSDAA